MSHVHRFVEFVRAEPDGSVHRLRRCVVCDAGDRVEIARDPWRDPTQAMGGMTGRDRDERRVR